MSDVQKIEALQLRVIPEAIPVEASELKIHMYNRDADIDLFEYTLKGDNKSELIEGFKGRFSSGWTQVSETSDSLVFTQTKDNKPFWKIERRVDVFVSDKNRVLVLHCGIDSPAEIEFYNTRAVPLYKARVEKLKSP